MKDWQKNYECGDVSYPYLTCRKLLNRGNNASRQTTYNVCHRSSIYRIDTVHKNGECDKSFFIKIRSNQWTIRHQTWSESREEYFSLEDTSQTSRGFRTATDTQCCTPCSGRKTTATKSSGARDSLHNGGHRTQSNKYTREIGVS